MDLLKNGRSDGTIFQELFACELKIVNRESLKRFNVLS